MDEFLLLGAINALSPVKFEFGYEDNLNYWKTKLALVLYFAAINILALATSLETEGICAGATAGTFYIPGVGEVAIAATAIVSGAIVIDSIKEVYLAKGIGTAGGKVAQNADDKERDINIK